MAWQQVGTLDEQGLPMFICNEADTKPTTGKNVVPGAKVIQLDGDTKGVHIFDGTAWYNIPSGGGMDISVLEPFFSATKKDIYTWAGIQEIVRAGLHTSVFSVGDQLVAKQGVTDYTYDVIGINQDTPTSLDFTNTMTLQMHKVLKKIPFNSRELLYYAEAALPPGTYHFYSGGNPASDYQFTTTLEIPAGGGIKLTYAAFNITDGASSINSSLATVETFTLTVGTGGTLLAVHPYPWCALKGGSRYDYSNLRQWLNSDGATYAWEKTYGYNMPPTHAAYNTPGFLYDLDPELRAVIGPVNKMWQLPNPGGMEPGGYETVSDTVFLLSRVEVYGDDYWTPENSPETPYPYYFDLNTYPTDGVVAGRIKQLVSANTAFWLRSSWSLEVPEINPWDVSTVDSDGTVWTYSAMDTYAGIAPAMCIV